MNPSSPPPQLPTPPAHSGLATASMVCGFLALPTCFATMLPAIIMGHIARSKADRDGRNVSRAKLGLIFGYGSLAAIPLIAVIAGLAAPLVIRQRQKADLTECISHARQIGLALMEYETEHGEYPPDLKQLETAGFTTNIDELLALRPVHSGDWLYYPKADKKPSSPLLVTPPIGGKHLVLKVDGSVGSMDPATFAEAGENGANAPIRIPAPQPVAK